MKVKDEYKIELTEEHLDGAICDVKNCMGARAFKDAVISAHTNPDIGGINWGAYDGALNSTTRYKSFIDNENVNMMSLRKKDIGKTVVFKIKKH